MLLVRLEKDVWVDPEQVAAVGPYRGLNEEYRAALTLKGSSHLLPTSLSVAEVMIALEQAARP